MLPQFLEKAETTENLSVGTAGFAPDLGRTSRIPCRTQPTRILSERHLAAGASRFRDICQGGSASWILVVDSERSGLSWRVDP